jgi:hypothetical protein
MYYIVYIKLYIHNFIYIYTHTLWYPMKSIELLSSLYGEEAEK